MASFLCGINTSVHAQANSILEKTFTLKTNFRENEIAIHDDLAPVSNKI